MTAVSRGWKIAVVAAGLLLWTVLCCEAREQMRGSRSSGADAYAAPSACARCHEEIAKTYARTDMAHSFSRFSNDSSRESLHGPVVFRHGPSRTMFSMEEEMGNVYQKRWQEDEGGKPIHLDSASVDYVMGSGSHAKTYLHRNASGTLTELPLARYAENGGSWALNPGFDHAAPPTRNLISYDCMFCHNAYPNIPADNGDAIAHPVFSGDLPEGIDCQRCHGPGRAHIERAEDPRASGKDVRAAILNPARLDEEHQMEVCMQCHLETTSFHLPGRIRRYDQRPFGYLPGRPLASFFQYFQPDLKGESDPRFGIDSAAYRLRQSKCYLGSSGALTCERCHDPHEPHQSADAEHGYRQACVGCHQAKVKVLVAEHKHPAGADCIDCHMPKRRTDDVVKVVMTDHMIQRPSFDRASFRLPKKEIFESLKTSYRGEVKPYPVGTFTAADDELYIAAAQVLHDSNADAGIKALEALIARDKPKVPDFSIDLGDALYRGGHLPEAILAYRDALRIAPHSLRARRSLGAVLIAAGHAKEALDELEIALKDSPDESLVWYEMGRAHLKLGQFATAVRELTRATELDPDLAEAFNDLGIALAQSGRSSEARDAFLESIKIAPFNRSVYQNLLMLGDQSTKAKHENGTSR